MDITHSSKAKFKLAGGHNDIIIAEFPANVVLDLDTAVDIVTDRLSFTENKKHYLIANVSNVLSITKEAKKYLQNSEGGLKNILGAALIASNPLSALIANIFIKTPSKFQSRFFSNMDEALNWMCAQKENC
jgi:hypothetical protein